MFGGDSMIGRFLVRIGTWMNKHFPEKVSTDEIRVALNSIELRLHEVTELTNNLDGLRALGSEHGEQIVMLSKRVDALTSENTALKAASALRVRSSFTMPGR